MPSPHPFARFIQILGRGKTLSRSLTMEEAQEAMAMILAGEVLPEQLGAFLMLLRVKEESPEEIAGFVLAARAAWPSLAPAEGGSRLVLLCRQAQATAVVHPGRAHAGAEWHARLHARRGRAYAGPRLYERSSGALAYSGRRELRGSGRASRAAQFRLYACSRRSAPCLRTLSICARSSAALAGAHTVAHAQSLCRAGDAARRLPSRLYEYSPGRGAAARPAAYGGVPRRRRRDRAAPEQALRGADGPRRRDCRGALARSSS